VFGGSLVTFTNCTFAKNIARWFGGGILADTAPNCSLINSIFWDNFGLDGSSIALVSIPSIVSTELNVNYCDVQGGETGVFVETPDTLIWGEGNFDSDPLFVSGKTGDFYLSQVDSGQQVDSPCLDTGDSQASDVCFESLLGTVCLNSLTTRSDQGFDTGVVDIGSHNAFVEDLPTPTPTPTMTPTCTPTPSPILGVELHLSQEMFHPGDEFLLEAIISNPGPDLYPDHAFVVMLDVFSNYFWHPHYEESFEFEQIDVEIGSLNKVIMHFEWPNVDGETHGIVFYSAILNPNLSEIIGEWDWVTFGWEP
ncbi:hypothetical protein K8T06_04670, partial [bacterium]|nr:hypothetical protein [bacterium]